MLILGLLSGLCYQLLTEGVYGILLWLVPMFVTFLIIYPFFKIGGLGAGDVKFLLVCTGFLPLHKVLVFLLVVFLIGGTLAFGILCVRRTLIIRIKNLYHYFRHFFYFGEWEMYGELKTTNKKERIHMAGPICISVLLYMGGVY